MSATTHPGDIATPPGIGGWLAGLLAEQRLPAALAGLGAKLNTLWSHPVRIGTKVIVARHAQVTEALARDLDFRIASINEARIDAVNGPFVLGMDRGATLASERQALYEALSAVDLDALRTAAAGRAQAAIAAAGPSIDVVDSYARRVAAATARDLFGVHDGDDATFMDAVRAIFAHVFLNLGGDKAIEARALNGAALMRQWLESEIARRRAAHTFGIDMMGRLLEFGRLDDSGVRRTLGGMLVGSIDTTASSVAKIVAMIGRDATLAARIAADADDPALLAGWCREALRRWPHNPIVLRQAATDTILAGTAISAGDQVFLWTQAAMLDPSMFPRPGTLRPDRPAAAYLHFGGGLHPCAGRAVNAFQIPLLVGTLVRRGISSVGRVDWAGPFPSHMILQFGR